MDSDLQKALQEPFKPEAALADADRAIAALQLLSTAAEWHPSLLVALIYPTCLSAPADGSTPQTPSAPPTSSSQVVQSPLSIRLHRLSLASAPDCQ